MAAALASALTGRKVRPDVAMTGEITLTGQVLPVGGIKEKLVAAKRSDIGKVILPARNREHVEEVDAALLEGLEFIYADTIDDVLDAALIKPGGEGKEGEPIESEEAAEAVR